MSARHPLREALTLVAGTALAGVAFVLLVALVVEIAATAMPASWEARAFGWFWSLSEPDDPSPDRDALQKLVDRIAGHWWENPYQFQAAIMEDPAPNAFALPGGRIFVTRGLLELVESENELAFVLGHEIGHFGNRDHIRRLGRGLLVGVVWGSLVGDVGMSVPGLAVNLAGRGFDRGQESAADRFGLELLEQEYGHVMHADAFFRHLSEASESTALWASYFSTHPASDRRSRELRSWASERGWAKDGLATPLPAVLRGKPSLAEGDATP